MVIKKLQNFLINNNLSYAKFGKLINKSRAQVGMYVRGICKPKSDTMSLITQATNNEVQPNDFYRSQQPQEKK